MRLSPIQLRALRNATIAGVATAVLGFTAVGLLGGGGDGAGSDASRTEGSTPSPPPVACADAFETVPSADPSNKGDALLDVAALASDDAWAVGNAGPRDSLIEHWDGTSWAPVDSPNGNLRHNVLNGVAGTSPTDVWAVGASTLGAQSQALIEHWDGFTWSVVQAPGDLPANSALSAVAAVDPNDVWAVGASGNALAVRRTALILHWNGRLWSTIPGASLATGGSTLTDVAADAGSQIWAVGEEFADTLPSTASDPVIERWVGSGWAVVPNAGKAGDWLQGLAVAGSDAIWAAGNPIQLWNGGSWTVVRSPKASLADLRDVAVVAAEDVWAVGSLGGIEAGSRALIEHWDGQRWNFVRPPASDDRSRVLSATATSAGGGVWAVGSRVASDGSARTLILRRSCGTSPPT